MPAADQLLYPLLPHTLYIQTGLGHEVTDGAQAHCRTGDITATPGRFTGFAGGRLAADGADMREFERPCTRGAFLQYRTHHFGDDIACPLHDDRIPYPHVLGQDLVFIMQSGAGDHDPAYGHRLQLGHRGQDTGTSHLDLDTGQTGMHLHGRELESDSEARRAGREAQCLLRFKIILLGHGTVDLHGKIRPALTHAFHIGFHSGRIGAEFAVGRRQKAVIAQPGRQLVLEMTGFRLSPAGLAQTVSQESQGHLLGVGHIQLAQGPGSGIARIGQKLLAQGFPALVDGGKILFVDDHLAAHLQPFREGTGPAQPQGDRTDGTHGLGNHFTLFPVAAGQRLLQDAILIDNLQGKTIQFGVTPEGQRRFGQGALHAGHEFLPLLGGKDVVQTVHALTVALFGQTAQQTAPHAQRGRMGTAPLRMVFLQRLQLPEQGIVLVVADDRLVQRMIQIIVVLQDGRQPGHPLLGPVLWRFGQAQRIHRRRGCGCGRRRDDFFRSLFLGPFFGGRRGRGTEKGKLFWTHDHSGRAIRRSRRARIRSRRAAARSNSSSRAASRISFSRRWTSAAVSSAVRGTASS